MGKTKYVEIEVSIDLDDFTDNELIAECEFRDIMPDEPEEPFTNHKIMGKLEELCTLFNRFGIPHLKQIDYIDLLIKKVENEARRN